VYAELAAALVPPRTDAGAAPAAPPKSLGALATGVARHCFGAPGAGGKSVVFSLASAESSYVRASAPGLEPYADDLPALRMMIEYLTVLEGEFWVKLRGAGLTYGADLSHEQEGRRVLFELYRCTDPLAAYRAAKQIIADYASGASAIAPTEFGNARASLAYSLLSSKATKTAAAASAWSSAYDGRRADHARWLLEQIETVTPEQALHALRAYIVPLFDGMASVISVATTTSKLSAVADGLTEERGGEVVSYAGEEAVLKSVRADTDNAAELAAITTTVTKKSSVAFAFAKQFKCECPKCERPSDRGV
jgi:hypothetical protein